MNSALLSSKTMNWRTPEEFFWAIDNEFHFVLDAAADSLNKKCDRFYDEKTDGLAQSWNVGGPVWCNPPYGRQICKWVKKAYEESLNGVCSVLLIPARTDTSYFHDYILGKAEIRFVRGRLHFIDPETGKQTDSAPFPSMLVIFGTGSTKVGDYKCVF